MTSELRTTDPRVPQAQVLLKFSKRVIHDQRNRMIFPGASNFPLTCPNSDQFSHNRRDTRSKRNEMIIIIYII